MNIKHFISIIVLIASIGIFESCTENPIPYDLSDSELNIDTLTIRTFDGGTYLSPPLMGGIKGLHFGNNNGFKNLFSLIQFSQLSLNGTTRTYSLLDSTVSIDSVVVTFTSTKDTLLTDSNFELFYFPMSGDSIFDETESNYLNTTEVGLGNAISMGYSNFIQDEPDSTESIYPSLNFKVEDTNELIKFIADTTDNQNRTFMLKNVDSIDDFVSIRSRETEYLPILNVYYRAETDTLHSIFMPTKDISIVEPRMITESDMSSLSVGRASGLKSIMQFNFDELLLDSTSIVIKSAALVVNAESEISLDDFEIIAVVLDKSIPVTDFWEIGEDEYTIESDLLMTGTFKDNQLEMEIRPFIQGINTDSYSNFGLKLYGSSNSNPFQTVNLNLNANPYLRIVYVEL